MLVRLNKFLADNGIASRRKAEQFILGGRVQVNGDFIRELGTKVDPDKDIVEVDKKPINPETKTVVIMLNKPVGYTCTTKEFKGEKNVLELVKTELRVYPVGRLDKNSSGLLLLTNDGELTNHLTHPRYEKEKEYEVEVNHEIDQNFAHQMEQGIDIDEGLTAPCKVKLTGAKSFTIVLKQGKKRQVRQMCRALGVTVSKLHRTRVNKLKLGDVSFGKYRTLNEQEIALLK
jgi:23S rRNA pseudouridine2605 synthase